MDKNNTKKKDQLGMSIGTASYKLKKSLMFNLVKRLGENYCYQCSAEITSEEEFSVEHKIPYLDSNNPVKLFFDINNIAYSHLSCNTGAARSPNKITSMDDPRIKHGTYSSYNKRKCKCNECRAYQKEVNAKRRKK